MSTLTTASLAHFTGSETFTRHGLVRSIVLSEGAMHVAEAGGAHWLLDTIAITQETEPKVMAEEFQAWKLTVAECKGKIVCEDGNDNVVWSQEIAFTDFPLPSVELWYENRTIYLPSEH